jgi:tetratricopeptide (TPR) repeat protein
MIELTKDEVFILGGLGITGVLMNELQRSESLIILLQQYRPRNAAGFVAEALYFSAKGDPHTAIEILEESNALEMETNYEQAISLYIHLLHTVGRKSEAYEIAQEILKEGIVTQRHSLDLIQNILKKSTAGNT